MAIDWLSFFIGMGVALIVMNIVSLIIAYNRRSKARKDLSRSEAKIKEIQKKLEKGRRQVSDQIKEIKEGKE